MKVSSLAGIAYASIISVLHMPREKININADHIILIFYIICAFDGIICPKQKQSPNPDVIRLRGIVYNSVHGNEIILLSVDPAVHFIRPCCAARFIPRF